MRPALAWLFDRGDPVLMRQAIQDQAALSTLRSQIGRALATPSGTPIPTGTRGDNLILALVALRLKFPREEAEAKLEKNLALRQSS
ncbi:MAG: hypothetical protein KF883_13105 [Thermomicrobiales bacterium]|nr:hypothetical protein [Thermomicrobiales bacterium]